MFFFTFDVSVIIALIYVIIGSFTDIKTLEVPDWVSYSLIAIGFALNIVFSIYYGAFFYILKSILGFALAFLIGVGFYYTGQWGGGDSKVLFGLGALLGLSYPFSPEIILSDFFIKFIINMLFFGAFYGLFWVFVMALKNREKLKKELKGNLINKRLIFIRYVTAIISISLLLFIYFSGFLDRSTKLITSCLVIALYLMNYLFVFVRAVEKTAMIKLIEPEKLTEGDWIVDEIKIDGKYITGPKELGITKDQIQEILKLKKQGKIDKIKVKYGIPFIPSFLLSLLYTYFTGKLLFFL